MINEEMPQSITVQYVYTTFSNQINLIWSGLRPPFTQASSDQEGNPWETKSVPPHTHFDW